MTHAIVLPDSVEGTFDEIADTFEDEETGEWSEDPAGRDAGARADAQGS